MSDETYATRTLQRVNGYLTDCYQRADSDDARAQLDNLGCLYSWLADAVAAQSREFRHYVAAERTALDERDEALRTIDELREELEALRDGLAAGVANGGQK